MTGVTFAPESCTIRASEEDRSIETRVVAVLKHQHMRAPCQGDALAQGGVKSADARQRAPAAAKWVAGSGWPLCAHEMSPTT